MVVSVAETSDLIPTGTVEQGERKRTVDEVSKAVRRCQNRGLTLPLGSARDNPETRPSGIRHVDGAKLNQALVWNVRTCAPMTVRASGTTTRERSQVAHTARTRVPMRSAGAEQLVVAMTVL
jgi:hypothetical protein